MHYSGQRMHYSGQPALLNRHYRGTVALLNVGRIVVTIAFVFTHPPEDDKKKNRTFRIFLNCATRFHWHYSGKLALATLPAP